MPFTVQQLIEGRQCVREVKDGVMAAFARLKEII